MGMVKVASYFSPFTANLALAKLQAEGIEARLAGDATTSLGYGVATAHVDLLVPADRADLAKRLLPRDAPRPLPACPKCGSRQVARRPRPWSEILLALPTLGLLLAFFNPWWRCESCGHAFAAREPELFEDEDD
jgi:hypothetical protein